MFGTCRVMSMSIAFSSAADRWRSGVASGPKSTRALALAVMESKGLDAGDKALATRTMPCEHRMRLRI